MADVRRERDVARELDAVLLDEHDRRAGMLRTCARAHGEVDMVLANIEADAATLYERIKAAVAKDGPDAEKVSGGEWAGILAAAGKLVGDVALLLAKGAR